MLENDFNEISRMTLSTDDSHEVFVHIQVVPQERTRYRPSGRQCFEEARSNFIQVLVIPAIGSDGEFVFMLLVL